LNYLLEKYIYTIINEDILITKELHNCDELHIFDFDMTLYNPNEKKWIKEVVEEAEKAINNKNNITVLCTARTNTEDITTETIRLLKDKGLIFNHHCFKPEKRKMSTPKYKAEAVENLLNKYKDLSSVYFWDDRQDNLNAVEKVVNSSNLAYKGNKT
jgi:predicted phosphatase